MCFSNTREGVTHANDVLMRQKSRGFRKKNGKNGYAETEEQFHCWEERENIVYGRSYGELTDAYCEKCQIFSIE